MSNERFHKISLKVRKLLLGIISTHNKSFSFTINFPLLQQFPYLICKDQFKPALQTTEIPAKDLLDLI
jgi:hypothetical protein